ncbi:hypothetical protein GQ42DRAFT_165216 [Ramicandelaber brevisporus]|nr:hypothetical protein GQ42DRAFT_165216 [Ramicandelaber brevisporus]
MSQRRDTANSGSSSNSSSSSNRDSTASSNSSVPRWIRTMRIIEQYRRDQQPQKQQQQQQQTRQLSFESTSSISEHQPEEQMAETTGAKPAQTQFEAPHQPATARQVVFADAQVQVDQEDLSPQFQHHSRQHGRHCDRHRDRHRDRNSASSALEYDSAEYNSRRHHVVAIREVHIQPLITADPMRSKALLKRTADMHLSRVRNRRRRSPTNQEHQRPRRQVHWSAEAGFVNNIDDIESNDDDSDDIRHQQKSKRQHRQHPDSQYQQEPRRNYSQVPRIPTNSDTIDAATAAAPHKQPLLKATRLYSRNMPY